MEGNDTHIKVIVAGAGKAGELIAKDISENKLSPFRIIGFVDDDLKKQKIKIENIKVLGTIADLKKIVEKNNIEEIFIAIPSERGTVIRKIVENTAGLAVVYKILPRLSEVLMQEYSKDFVRFIRKVRIEDLLGGEILKADQSQISEYAKDQVVMITGAAGSIGSELSRQITSHGAKKIILYDWWENGMFELRNQLIENNPEDRFEFIIGDIKDKNKLNLVIKTLKPTTIFHAAAYKHVPLMENNPAEAIKNNILGTRIVAEAAIDHHVKKFILVSSDKAVNPTNIMGATKRAAEKIIHILSQTANSTTVFCAVRFGNVVNSNGSVIPIFERQIEKGGPVTVTDKSVTRYFMTIPEAVHLILQSWVMGDNNDLFVLDMGEPIKIYDLARLLIILQGYIPNEDIKIEIIGLRPGEKMYEEVLVGPEKTNSTTVDKIFRTKNYMEFDKLEFISNVDLLIDSLEEHDLNVQMLRDRLKQIVSTYNPSSKN